MISALAMAGYLNTAEPRTVPVAHHRVRVGVTTNAETPLPDDLAPIYLTELGTGQITVSPDTGDLVRSASKYVEALALLPINAEDEALVDGIVGAQVVGTANKRSLRRG